MIVRVIGALLLIGGIALGVIVTFFGVERRRGKEIRRPHPAINLPAVAAAMTAWGAVGYSLARGGVGLVWTIVIASAAAAAAWVGMGALLAKWALRAPLVDPHEIAEAIQGHVAVVTSAIGDEPGRISYHLHGETHVVPARSLDGQPITEGTDVVIERIEGNLAWVEPWSLVERRL
jgi:hypothetical protein